MDSRAPFFSHFHLLLVGLFLGGYLGHAWKCSGLTRGSVLYGSHSWWDSGHPKGGGTELSCILGWRLPYCPHMSGLAKWAMWGSRELKLRSGSRGEWPVTLSPRPGAISLDAFLQDSEPCWALSGVCVGGTRASSAWAWGVWGRGGAAGGPEWQVHLRPSI